MPLRNPAPQGTRILVVDDQPELAELIKTVLGEEGYEVSVCTDGRAAIQAIEKEMPAALILDIMMPKMNGVEVCKILRSKSEYNNTLIIFLTALSDESSQIKGLETGADDYVNKPISPKVLVSRVNAIFRRIHKEEGKAIKFGNMSIDPEKFMVVLNGKDVVLAKKEIELLYI